MIDLPVATRQPYPSKNPWYDVSQYLTAGLRAYSQDSVAACADDNFVHYAFYIAVDKWNPDLEVNWLMKNMHPSLRVSAAVATSAWFTTNSGAEVHRVAIADSGWMGMSLWPNMGVSLSDFTLASLTLTAPRGMP